MTRKVLAHLSVYILWISFAEAAITPQNANYVADVGDNVTFPWFYEYADDASTVIWSHQRPFRIRKDEIMVYSPGTTARALNSYDVIHNGNGNVTLRNVTESYTGVYYCYVSYIQSLHSSVTGTATLTVNVPSRISTSVGSTTGSTSTVSAVKTTESTSGSSTITYRDDKAEVLLLVVVWIWQLLVPF